MGIDKLGRISVALLKDVCTQHMPLSRLDRQSRANLYFAIARQDRTVQELINSGASNAIEAGLTKHRKRTRNQEGEDGQGPSQRPRPNQEEVILESRGTNRFTVNEVHIKLNNHLKVWQNCSLQADL
jgi:hypothetical protein